MFKAIVRFLLVLVQSVLEAVIILFLERHEILGFQMIVRPIQKSENDEQKILVKYLENCRKQTCKEENGKKRSTEKTNRKTKKIL